MDEVFLHFFLFPCVFILPSTLLVKFSPYMFSHLFQVLFLLIFLPSPPHFITLYSFSLISFVSHLLFLLPFFSHWQYSSITFFLLLSGVRDSELQNYMEEEVWIFIQCIIFRLSKISLLVKGRICVHDAY